MRTLRVIVFIALSVLMLLPAVWLRPAIADEPTTPDLLEIVEISGVISMGTANAIKDQVEQIAQNRKIKAVLLIVDTPGGGVLATSSVYDELSKLKVPAVAWCPYVCASGGLYVMMAPSIKHVGLRADSITGSVGVIAQVTNYNRLLEWAMVDVETYKSGMLKDSGSGARETTDADRQYLQGVIDNLAKKFYAVVDHSRKITDWPAVQSARIFIGEEAVQVGLADEIMSREAAISKAKDLSGSPSIYTRDELKQMSRVADSGYRYEAPPNVYENSLGFALELMQEIKRGEAIRFSYLMQFQF